MAGGRKVLKNYQKIKLETKTLMMSKWVAMETSTENIGQSLSVTKKNSQSATNSQAN